MINFEKSLRTVVIKDLQAYQLSNSEKAAVLVASLSKGIVGEQIPLREIKRRWPKALFKVVFHPSYLTGASDEGWLNRSVPGVASLTEEGLGHFNGLITRSSSEPLADTTELMVFSPKQSHDFDLFIRNALTSAKGHIRLADSYVDETIFDNYLNVVGDRVRIDLMFNHDTGTVFQARAKRFRIQYPNFTYARYPKLHDRYLIVDGIGFVIGPSLKDATVNSPAVLVRVGIAESQKLVTLFDNIYSKQKKLS